MLRLRVLFLRTVRMGLMKAGEEGSEGKFDPKGEGAGNTLEETVLVRGRAEEVSTARFLRLRGFLACGTGRLR